MFQSVRDFKISKYAVLTVKYISTVKYIKIEMLKKQQFLNYLVKYSNNKQNKIEFCFSIFYVLSQKIWEI